MHYYSNVRIITRLWFKYQMSIDYKKYRPLRAAYCSIWLRGCEKFLFVDSANEKPEQQRKLRQRTREKEQVCYRFAAQQEVHNNRNKAANGFNHKENSKKFRDELRAADEQPQREHPKRKEHLADHVAVFIRAEAEERHFVELCARKRAVLSADVHNRHILADEAHEQDYAAQCGKQHHQLCQTFINRMQETIQRDCRKEVAQRHDDIADDSGARKSHVCQQVGRRGRGVRGQHLLAEKQFRKKAGDDHEQEQQARDPGGFLSGFHLILSFQFLIFISVKFDIFRSKQGIPT
ncbi:hypothetical protein SDC9_55605 [bioreactor metagenome]|uniref:Uncharacterized protein n=1 Tax=bioreactor metagenome TaxID=1076179 RepID=A0A644WZL9_9ZZZZ